MEFRKLFADLNIRKGRGDYMFGEKEPLPDTMRSALHGYGKWCLVYSSHKHEIYVCAVPEKGGEYLVLGELSSRVAAIEEDEYPQDEEIISL